MFESVGWPFKLLCDWPELVTCVDRPVSFIEAGHAVDQLVYKRMQEINLGDFTYSELDESVDRASV